MDCNSGEPLIRTKACEGRVPKVQGLSHSDLLISQAKGQRNYIDFNKDQLFFVSFTRVFRLWFFFRSFYLTMIKKKK